MKDREKTLNAAKAQLRELEKKIQRYVDANPGKSLDQLEKDQAFRILSKQADNAERVIKRLQDS